MLLGPCGSHHMITPAMYTMQFAYLECEVNLFATSQQTDIMRVKHALLKCTSTVLSGSIIVNAEIIVL